MRSALAFLCVLLLAGCGWLSQLGLVPAPGSQHLESEPAQCGAFQDPVRASDVASPIVGAAELHSHQFANLGFGGRIVWGEPFNERGIEAALSECGVNELCTDAKEDFVCDELICRFTSDRQACRAGCDRYACDNPPPHGRAGIADPVSTVLRGEAGHRVTGYPDFQGWPAYNSFTHQQVYHRWLRRAFDGGLKLMVMLAVTNQVLCELWEHDHACDDMSNAELQLLAAKELERYIDYQNDCDVNDNGWYRIAETPRDAREIIADGAMAVVLGLEVDALFNCYAPDRPLAPRTACTERDVQDQIQKYRALGVRHVFPIHLFDNGFGGAAAYNDIFNFGNAYVNRELFDVHACGESYSFRFGEMSGMADDFLATAAKTLGFPYQRYAELETHCNTRGLTGLGKQALGMLMDHKMIIDVDHMSTISRGEALQLAEGRAYPGLVSSHAGFTEVNIGDKRHEGQLTPKEVERLIKLGGMLAPILNQGNLAQVKTYERTDGGTQVRADCGSSSKGFAQAYFYAVDQMKAHKRSDSVLGVGFGSDFNGLVATPAPRFGKHACDGDRSADQGDQVSYPVETAGGLMNRSVIGSRTYDINTDGFAHVGMFPDFVADLRELGLTEADLKPLFSSAEAYVQLWERVEATAALRRPAQH